MFGFFSSQSADHGVIDLQVWRMTGAGTYNQWGDIDPAAEEAPIPALAGRTLVETIEDCVFEPRTTRLNAKDQGVDGTITTAITVFLSSLHADIREGDFFAFDNHNGKVSAWKIDGEVSSNNYVSPFTGTIGGRELFLTRVKGVK